MRQQVGVRPGQVRQTAQHFLFVEGSTDVRVLEELLDLRIRVEPLGASYSIKSVAQALHRHHPEYYFLIDRDTHHDDDFVEQCWKSFPDPATHNLLVWRRREIENYFIDPRYLCQSSFCEVGEMELADKLLELARRRLFLDAANLVVIDVREKQKRNWIEVFAEGDNLSSAEIAVEKLKSRPEFSQRCVDISDSVSSDELERRFRETLMKMTGGGNDLIRGRGNWVEIIQGKPIFKQLVNSAFFHVRTSDGTTLTGAEKSREIVKDLLRKEASVQPADFQELKRLILKRIQAV